ncbi:VOC family protein [Mesorhizobium sp. 131-2-1]|uniref:VOC family protein n=1 Tax=Mesorhizobium sp. 131-2-1 TaxID=2744518 RepID=UPI001928EAA7|nr:VOC family protein [Mesorhizobium sp. 131-2-1]BCG96724.1 hypothetical protein MesoLj131a_55880 [Mesorhizobium sp. 131-2-1]
MPYNPSIVPYFSYVDAKAAINFLKEAFGLELIQSVLGKDGKVIHAEMRFGNGVIMMGTVEAKPTMGGAGVYLVVDDVEGHHKRAAKMGATIVYPPEDTGFGTRRYRAFDCEGHEWSFGTYRPVAG